jgi:hypothetical protein
MEFIEAQNTKGWFRRAIVFWRATAEAKDNCQSKLQSLLNIIWKWYYVRPLDLKTWHVTSYETSNDIPLQLQLVGIGYLWYKRGLSLIYQVGEILKSKNGVAGF